MAPRPKNPPPDRRSEILEAAFHLFAEKGFTDTTNADIARAAGVTPAALYYYFPSKEELFRAAMSERRGQIEPILAEWGQGEESLAIPPHEALPVLLRKIVAFFTEERTQALLKIVVAEGPRNPAILAIWQEQVITVAGQIFPYLLHHAQRGNLPPVDARLLFLSLTGPVMATVITRDLMKIPMLQDISNEALVEALISTTLKGMLAAPESGRGGN